MGAIDARDIKTSKPRYDSRGLVIGYDQPNFSGPDYPVWNSGTGQLESIQTGKKWTKAIPGQPPPQPDPSDPNRYGAVSVVKNPVQADANNAIMSQFKTLAAQTDKGWQDYFNEAKAAQAVSKQAFLNDQKAIDVAPTAAALRSNLTDFAGTSRRIGTEYAARDADYETAQRALVDRANAVLPQYDAAADAIAARQLAAAGAQVSRYKAGSGTPRSLGSSELALQNRAAADILLPLEREKIARRMGLITDFESPLEREYANRDVARYTQFDYPNERYLSERGADTEKQIKQLELAVSGMSRSQAEQYIRSLGLPMEIAQQVLSRHIANLAGIAGLDEAAYYRGLQDKVGANLSQPVYYSPATGNYPVYPVSSFTGSTGASSVAAANPGPSYPTVNLPNSPTLQAIRERYAWNQPTPANA